MRSLTTLAVTFSASLWLLACAPMPERPTPSNVDRDAKVVELQKENERLRAEREAAQRSSAALDATLRGVEDELGGMVGMDSDIRVLQRDIETGINVKSPRRNIRKMIEKLKTALGERQNLVSKAQTNLKKAKEQVPQQQDAGVRQAYVQQVARLELLINQQIAENDRLTRDRDSYERLYREAAAAAKEARTQTEAVKVELDAEHLRREEAERLQNRVLVVSATKAELRLKGILTGRWFQRKSSNCACADCLKEEDRRTLATVPIPAPPKSVTVYSSHPAGSFRLVASGSAAVLEIVDADKFWSGSHCLVIGY